MHQEAVTSGDREVARQRDDTPERRSPEDPEGNILCSIAENKLTVDVLHVRHHAIGREGGAAKRGGACRLDARCRRRVALAFA